MNYPITLIIFIASFIAFAQDCDKQRYEELKKINLKDMTEEQYKEYIALGYACQNFKIDSLKQNNENKTDTKNDSYTVETFPTQLDKKHMITASLIQGTNGIGFNGGMFTFSKGNYLFRFGGIYELEFFHVGNTDTNKTDLIGFGGAIGLLIGPDKSPISFLLDVRIPVGSTFGGASPGFFIGIGSSQLIVLRLGADFRFIINCGGYEMALAGTNPLSFVGIRFSIGLEVPE